MLEEYKVGEVFKYKDYYLRVEEERTFSCKECFFHFDNYPYIKIKENTCCRTMNHSLLCTKINRADKTNIIFKKLSDIEHLILKGSDKSED